MLRKSVETRDCLGSMEPRSVKSVMKRVVEDITAIDKSISQVGSVFGVFDHANYLLKCYKIIMK